MIRIKGYVDEAGELHFEPPQGLEPGEVTITIEGEQVNKDSKDTDELHFEGNTGAEIMASGVFGAWADQDNENNDEPRSQAKTGAEIAASDVVGSWAHLEIEDSVAYIEEIRKQERENRGW